MMSKSIGALVVALLCVPAVWAAPPQQAQGKAGEPTWAYGFDSPPKPGDTGVPPAAAAPDNPTEKHVPGSPLAFTQKQIANPFGPADWFPGDHPQMPDIVARGRATEVRACSLCP